MNKTELKDILKNKDKYSEKYLAEEKQKYLETNKQVHDNIIDTHFSYYNFNRRKDFKAFEVLFEELKNLEIIDDGFQEFNQKRGLLYTQSKKWRAYKHSLLKQTKLPIEDFAVYLKNHLLLSDEKIDLIINSKSGRKNTYSFIPSYNQVPLQDKKKFTKKEIQETYLKLKSKNPSIEVLKCYNNSKVFNDKLIEYLRDKLTNLDLVAKEIKEIDKKCNNDFYKN